MKKKQLLATIGRGGEEGRSLDEAYRHRAGTRSDNRVGPADMAWMQGVVDAHAAGDNAAFSAFLHRETLRCLSEEPALVVP